MQVELPKGRKTWPVTVDIMGTTDQVMHLTKHYRDGIEDIEFGKGHWAWLGLALGLVAINGSRYEDGPLGTKLDELRPRVIRNVTPNTVQIIDRWGDWITITDQQAFALKGRIAQLLQEPL